MVTMSIDQSHGQYVIRFSEPLRVYVLAVATADGEIIWKVSPLAFQPNDVATLAFFSFPSHQVPAVVRKQFEDVCEVVPTVQIPFVKDVTYGVVPYGYKERDKARPLQPRTKYRVLAMGDGQDATAVFTTDE